MTKTLASAFLALGLVGVLAPAGHAESFPQSALADAPMSRSANRAPAESTALRTGFPTFTLVRDGVISTSRPSRDQSVGSIDFPGMSRAASQVRVGPVEGVAGARRG